MRGLESLDRNHVVKCFLDYFNHMDFLMLQELKSTNFVLESNLNIIWNDAIKLHFNNNKEKGHVGLLIRPKLALFILDKGVSPCNREV